MQTNDNPRVALSKILVLAEYLQTRCGVPKFVASEISEIERAAKAALAAPPRNCDVGTAEEQYKRFMNMCNSKDVRQCAECSMRGFTPGCSRDRCFANWAQMPCEEGGDK